MPLAFYRLKPTMAFRVLLTALIAYIIAYVPNYQKDFYQNTRAVDYGSYYCGTGFPAGEGYPVAKSIEDLETCDFYVIEVDVKDMQETKLCEYICDGGMFKKPNLQLLWRNQSDYGIGQYYAVTLESGEKVLVFLDDTALDIPKSGKITLPVGETCYAKFNNSFSKVYEEYQITQGENVLYVDMASDWRRSEMGKKLNKYTGDLYLGTLFGFTLLQIVVHIIYKKVKNTNNKTN